MLGCTEPSKPPKNHRMHRVEWLCALLGVAARCLAIQWSAANDVRCRLARPTSDVWDCPTGIFWLAVPATTGWPALLSHAMLNLPRMSPAVVHTGAVASLCVVESATPLLLWATVGALRRRRADCAGDGGGFLFPAWVVPLMTLNPLSILAAASLNVPSACVQCGAAAVCYLLARAAEAQTDDGAKKMKTAIPSVLAAAVAVAIASIKGAGSSQWLCFALIAVGSSLLPTWNRRRLGVALGGCLAALLIVLCCESHASDNYLTTAVLSFRRLTYRTLSPWWQRFDSHPTSDIDHVAPRALDILTTFSEHQRIMFPGERMLEREVAGTAFTVSGSASSDHAWQPDYHPSIALGWSMFQLNLPRYTDPVKLIIQFFLPVTVLAAMESRLLKVAATPAESQLRLLVLVVLCACISCHVADDVGVQDFLTAYHLIIVVGGSLSWPTAATMRDDTRSSPPPPSRSAPRGPYSMLYNIRYLRAATLAVAICLAQTHLYYQAWVAEQRLQSTMVVYGVFCLQMSFQVVTVQWATAALVRCQRGMEAVQPPHD